MNDRAESLLCPDGWGQTAGAGPEPGKVLVRTLPKNRFLLCIAIAALSGAGLQVLVDQSAAAPPQHRLRPSRMAKTEPAPSQTSTSADENVLDDPSDLYSDGVAAVVNDQIVSLYDLRQRLRLVISTSGMRPTADTMKRLKPQVLDQLKTEKLELEEAQRKNITVAPPEVDKEIEGIIKDNHLTMDQLKELLGKDNVAFETLRAQIAVQLAWQKAIEDEYADRINITEQDVNEELARIAEGANRPHYLVSEIFLAIDSPDQADAVLKNAQDLEAQIQSGAPFPTIARQFSQSPSAANGGDIGMVQEGQLSPELNDALKTLPIGSITPPIRSAGGYYILALRDKQEPESMLAAKPPVQQTPERPGYLPLARILLPMPPKASPDYIEGAMKAAGQIRQAVSSCDQAQKIISGVHGAVYMKLGEMKLADLSAQMQDALAKTQSGETTEPFRSSAGIEIIARCDKPAPRQASAWHMPTRDEVERRLFQQQISMLARRYIRDLKREASVETR